MSSGQGDAAEAATRFIKPVHEQYHAKIGFVIYDQSADVAFKTVGREVEEVCKDCSLSPSFFSFSLCLLVSLALCECVCVCVCVVRPLSEQYHASADVAFQTVGREVEEVCRGCSLYFFLLFLSRPPCLSLSLSLCVCVCVCLCLCVCVCVCVVRLSSIMQAQMWRPGLWAGRWRRCVRAPRECVRAFCVGE